MKLVVTGATGAAGSWIVDHFATDGGGDEHEHEHEVVGIDLDRPAKTGDNVTFLAVDCTEQGQVWEAILTANPDAVIHFAGIPRLGIVPGAETFLTNVAATYHVFEAAGQVGADVVWASSESLYGMPFAEEPFLPEYLPIDEAHPQRPEDGYGTSKLVGEAIAAKTVRRYDISVASIRPSWIQYPGEYRATDDRSTFDPESAPPSGNFWSYVDIRDVVSIVDAALQADIDGHEAYHAMAANNYLGRPTAAVIETVFGDLPEECEIEGEASAFSTAKAQTELGWEPAHGWREAETEAIDPPAFGPA